MEKSPQQPLENAKITPEVLATGELPSRDEAIDAVRREVNDLQAEINTVEEKAATPGFKANANEVLAAKLAKRDIAPKRERLAGLQSAWNDAGGNEIEQAEKAVESLNFKSSALDHVAAKNSLRDAKNAFYTRLQENFAPKVEELPYDIPGSSMAISSMYHEANEDTRAAVGEDIASIIDEIDNKAVKSETKQDSTEKETQKPEVDSTSDGEPSTDENAAEPETQSEPAEEVQDTADETSFETQAEEDGAAVSAEDSQVQEQLAARVRTENAQDAASRLSPLSTGQPANYEMIGAWDPVSEPAVRWPGPVGALNPVIDRDTLVANEARKSALREQRVNEVTTEEVVTPEATQPAASSRVPTRESWNAVTIENFKDAGRWVAATFWKNRRRSAERPQDSQSSRTGERRTLSKRWRSRLAVGSVAIAAGFAGFLEGKPRDGSNNVDASAQR